MTSNLHRLIVQADCYIPQDNPQVFLWEQIISLCQVLKGTDVYIGIGPALRTYGYKIVETIHSLGLEVFCDLNLLVKKTTMECDAKLIKRFNPDCLTVSCLSGSDSMRAFSQMLPDTKVFGTAILTNQGDAVAKALYGCTVAETIERLSQQVMIAEIAGIISPANEAPIARQYIGESQKIIAPSISPAWSINPHGAAYGPMTVGLAIEKYYVDSVVVGNAIVGHENPLIAVEKTLEEIARAVGREEETTEVLNFAIL